MREIGGYIEFEHYHRPMLHENGIKLNCGRNALAYLLEAYDVAKIAMPRFMCDSCDGVLKNHHAAIQYYSIGLDLKPMELSLEHDEWLYLVNFYGQLTNDDILEMRQKHPKLIVDNAQAYFQEPVEGVPTLYTCRKYFGLADGAILYSEKKIKVELQDESFERMGFLLGRFERTASEFYSEYVDNNRLFAHTPIKRMSKLTENLLRGIDYDAVKKTRGENFSYLHERLSGRNQLELFVPNGPFMYPLYVENGADLRKLLQARKIFIPTLWPAVFDRCEPNSLEYDMAKNILPIPIDQRYHTEDMEYLTQTILDLQSHEQK